MRIEQKATIMSIEAERKGFVNKDGALHYDIGTIQIITEYHIFSFIIDYEKGNNLKVGDEIKITIEK